MKRYVVCAIFLISTAGITHAQKTIRLNGYGGYVFNDNVGDYASQTNYYDGRINGGFQWGIGVEYEVVPAYGIELLYLRQDTKAPMDYYLSGDKHTDFDLAINYILFTGSRYLKPESKVVPYAGALFGAAIFNLKNPDNNTEQGTRTTFAWGLKGGVLFKTDSRVSIKLQATLLSALQSVGGGYYFGAGAGVTTYSSIFQFGFSGGLSVRLWSAKTKDAAVK